MSWKLFLFTFTFTLADIICAPIDLKPCALDDTECLKELITTLSQAIIPGDKELGIPPLDPLYFDRIDGNFDTVKYTLTDSKLTGDSNFEIQSVSITPDGKTGVIKVVFPKLRQSGQYVTNGTIIGVPVNGKGSYFIEPYDYLVTLTSELKRVKGKDGKIHLFFKNFKADADLRKGFDFDLENLFDGNKQLADEFKKLVKENWKPVADLMQGPIIDANIKAVLERLNMYLKNIPIDNLLKA